MRQLPMTVLPLSLVPTFLVPLFLIFHFICIAQVRNWKAEEAFSSGDFGNSQTASRLVSSAG